MLHKRADCTSDDTCMVLVMIIVKNIFEKNLFFCHLLVGPTISPGPFNVTVTTGIRAVLSCETTGIPPPNVSWKRNGTPLDISQQPGDYR